MAVLHEFQYYNHRAFSFHCPGCECSHFVPVEGPHKWEWDGNLEAPTFSPSILVNGDKSCPSMPLCHSFIRQGKWQYLSDCTHKLAGTTVPMMDE